MITVKMRFAPRNRICASAYAAGTELSSMNAVASTAYSAELPNHCSSGTSVNTRT